MVDGEVREEGNEGVVTGGDGGIGTQNGDQEVSVAPAFGGAPWLGRVVLFRWSRRAVLLSFAKGGGFHWANYFRQFYK